MSPTTNPKVVFLVVGTLALMGLMGMFSLCLGLFVHIYADASLMSTVNTLTSGAAGALVGVLASTRTTPPAASTTTESTTTSTVTTPAPTASASTSGPTEVKVVNTASEPAQVEVAKP